MEPMVISMIRCMILLCCDLIIHRVILAKKEKVREECRALPKAVSIGVLAFASPGPFTLFLTTLVSYHFLLNIVLVIPANEKRESWVELSPRNYAFRFFRLRAFRPSFLTPMTMMVAPRTTPAVHTTSAPNADAVGFSGMMNPFVSSFIICLVIPANFRAKKRVRDELSFLIYF